MTTVGGTELSLSPSRRSPSMAVSSSWTIFTSCCAGDTVRSCADADGFLLDPFEELAGELEVDVGFEQDATDLAQPFLDVGVGENAASAQARERGFQLGTQLVEHSR